MIRKVVGCMTGTSMDGLDVCLMQIEGQGFKMKVKILAQGSFDLDSFRERFQKISSSQAIELSDYLQTALDFGSFHATSISSVVKKHKIDLICVHGQTLFHKPPLSLQLMNPYPIASKLETPVVYDLRGMDLACGGEGAPITPIADQILYQIKQPTAILNFGGFCNYTFIQIEKSNLVVTGGDICACNLFLNQLTKNLFNKPFDEDGKFALKGKLNLSLFNVVVNLLKLQSDRKKSLGTNDDDIQLILNRAKLIPPHDILRTVCSAIAEVISKKIVLAETIIVAGGGAYNRCLMVELENKCKGQVKTSQDFGVPAEFREAACFAILGALSQDKIPITIPSITGGKHTFVSGSWVYPY